MALFSFFKTPRHQKFEYKPRYWDPEKEELNRRIEAAKRENKDPDAIKSRISSGMRRHYKYGSRSNSRGSKKSTIRLFVIIGFLLLFTYYFLVVYLPRFEEYLN